MDKIEFVYSGEYVKKYLKNQFDLLPEVCKENYTKLYFYTDKNHDQEIDKLYPDRYQFIWAAPIDEETAIKVNFELIYYVKGCHGFEKGHPLNSESKWKVLFKYTNLNKFWRFILRFIDYFVSNQIVKLYDFDGTSVTEKEIQINKNIGR